MQGVEIAFDVVIVILLCVLIVRQKGNHMEEETQLNQLEDATTALEAAETKLAADETAEIAYLKDIQAQLAAAGSPIDLGPIIAREQALLAKLQGDDTGLTDAVPEAPATPVS